MTKSGVFAKNMNVKLNGLPPMRSKFYRKNWTICDGSFKQFNSNVTNVKMNSNTKPRRFA